MDTSSLFHFFSQYGLIVLYAWLLIGIFIVPVPEEVVMLTVGILISQGDFSYMAYFVACAGSLCGVTVSYFLGRSLGRLFIVKYGRWIGVSDKRLAQGEALIQRHGKWSLPISYFIPGARHIVALVAGMTQFGWKRLALYDYPAGIVWVGILVFLGYIAGAYWLKVFYLTIDYFYYLVVFLCIVAVVLLIYWHNIHKKLRK